ncbi:glutathione S-transferase [Xylophilus rhododendri]|uniref:glutathione transferase n=1 Tax=Xylophilus rhododendri TaxID=2697032 RepID=A0A857JEC5_9BURK|nr:glutathione S-transferase family protein [Xylophilus rhododendri]QHJ01293.1 glutathione S-transferase [Xylophilus rhododendri]
MLTLHHLGKSQSERIVWLLEELALPYELVHHTRDAVTQLSPPALQALHPLGAAPVIVDGAILLAESGAIVQYILGRYGQGRLAPAPEHPGFADYLYWFHFANGNLQALMGRNMVLGRLDLPADNAVLASTRGRLDRALRLMDQRLGELPFLAGQALTAADIMTVFSLTTMRYFCPLDLSPYPQVLTYLQRIGRLDSYRRAMAKGDPGMPLLLD